MSNHLGDTNKMVDTPRTDGLLTAILDSDGFVHNGNCPQRWVNHARELERELNAASKERDDALMMLGMYRMKSEEQNQRIKRLEEAGDRMDLYAAPHDSDKWNEAMGRLNE